MTERERLIELIYGASDNVLSVPHIFYDGAEALADYLLANDVRVGKQMTTDTINRYYDDGPGVEVIFYDYGIEIGKAHTVEYNGKPNAFLHNFYVDKDLRGKGYGTRILRYMIENYDVDTLYVNKDNKSIRLYQRFGFEEIDMFDDMIVMQRKGR